MNRRLNHMCRNSPNKNVRVRNDCEAFAHISLQGLLLLLQLLSSTFSFFFRSKTKNLPPQQCEEPQVPLTHIPCSASLWLGTGLGGRRLTRVITGCLWPTESSWGPLRCEFVHPWECGPCCAANGPYPRCPPSACPRRWLTAALVSDLFCRAFLRRFPSWGMRLRAQSEKKEKKHAMFGKWLRTESLTTSYLHFPPSPLLQSVVV